MALSDELRTKWIEALRSGEYSQTKGRLKDEIGYCCLGVLACLIKETGHKYIDISSEQITIYDPSKGQSSYGVFPLNLQISIGLSNDHMNIGMRMNDSENMSFNEIADVIEQQQW